MTTIPGATAASELCQLAGVYQPAIHPRRAVVQHKVDGIRCLYIGGHLVTREGVHLEAAEHCRADLERLESAFGRRMFLDAEYEAGTFAQTLSAFRTAKPGRGVLHLFDAVPLEQWAAAGRTAPLSARMGMIEEVTSGLRLTTVHAMHDLGNGAATPDEVQDLYADEIARGGEGLIIKCADSPYYRGRAKTWLKLKPAEERTPSGKLRHPAKKETAR